MNYKTIVISPIKRPEQDILQREISCYRQELKRIFAKYNVVSCPYMILRSEPSYEQYQGNFAVVEFKNKHQAARAVRAVECGDVSYNRLKLTVRPLESSYCPIDKLSDTCLLKIFTLLPLVEQLKLSDVCHRWKSISRSLFEATTAIDLRKLKWSRARHKKYILEVKEHLRDVYCYDDDGLSVLRQCPRLANLALEFRSYRQLRRKGKLVRTAIYLQPKLLLSFGSLTRLMLKLRDDRYTFFSILQYLPATMTEIHLLNDAQEYGDVEKYGRKFIDLSKFVTLRALTLGNYDFDELSLIGLESLCSLIHLRFDGCSQLQQRHINQLKSFRNLEYLSLPRMVFRYLDIALILRRNPNLRFLHPPTIYAGNGDYDYCLWPDILALPHLSVLHMSGWRYDLNYEGTSSSVEFIQLDSNWFYSSVQFLHFFPNVKVMKLDGYRENISWIFRIRNEIVRREDKTPFKLVTGQVSETMETLKHYRFENFQHCEFLNEREESVMRSGEWSGWVTDGDPPPASRPSEVIFPQFPPADSPGVEVLTDDCLLRIFSLFSLDERMNLARVCRRWRAVIFRSWASLRSFDVRTFTSHENARRYIIEAGKYLRDVYHFGACGLSGIRAHCRRVQSLALDYRFRTCKCNSSVSYGKRRSVLDLKSTLVELRHLTRLLLKDVDVLMTDVLKHLPAGIEELHIFNKTVLRDVLGGEDNADDNLIDLSGYVKLRALTLINTEVGDANHPRGTPRIAGLDKLENLLYLRLGGSVDIEDPARSLGNLFALEYLAVHYCHMPRPDLTTLIENNRELQYLYIVDAFDVISDRLLLAITSLEKLRFLSLAKRCRWGEERVESTEFGFLSEIPNLQFLDCEGDFLLPAQLMLQLLSSAPKISMVNFSVESEWFISEVLRLVQRNLLRRGNEDSIVKIFIGGLGVKICENLEFSSPRVAVGDVPADAYQNSLDKDFWAGWYTSSSVSRVSEICDNMLISVYS